MPAKVALITGIQLGQDGSPIKPSCCWTRATRCTASLPRRQLDLTPLA